MCVIFYFLMFVDKSFDEMVLYDVLHYNEASSIACDSFYVS